MFRTMYLKMNLLGDGGGAGGGGAPPAAPTTTTTPTGDQTQMQKVVSDGWMKGVDEEFANDPIMKAVPDVPTLVKNYVNAQRMIGKKGFVLPDNNAAPERWKELYQALGGPAQDAYKYDLPKEHGLDEDFIKNFNKLAFENNILPHQAKALMDYYASEVRKEDEALIQARTEARSKAEATLKQEWGEGFDKKLHQAKAALKLFGDEQMSQFLEETGLGNEPAMVRFLAKLGENLKEDTFKSEAVGHLGVTKEEAQIEINSTMADLKGAYFNSAHPDHKRVVDRMNKLFGVVAS